MRPDVKLGVAISFVLVVVAGGYYLYRDSRDVAIPVSGKTGDLASLEGASNKNAGPGKSSARKTPKVSESTRRSAQPEQSKPVSAGKMDTRLADSGASRENRTRPGNQSRRRPADQARGAGRGSSASSSGRKPKGVSGLPSTSDRTVGGDPVRNKSTQKPVESRNPAARDSASTDAAKRTRSDRRRETPPEAKAAGGDRSASNKRPAGSGSREDPNRSAPSRHARSSPNIAVDTHRLQPGDTLAGLAVSYYGSERHVRLLLDANPQITNPDRLQVGAVVKIPPAPRGDRSAPNAAGTASEDSASPTGKKRTYTVQSGDSFYAIAQSQLGEASRWKELFELNKTLVKGDPKRLQIGQVITLPD